MANWIGRILGRNCLLEPDIEGKIETKTEATGRLGRRHKHLLDDRKEREDTGNRKKGR
jgi:hypothetical protein